MATVYVEWAVAELDQFLRVTAQVVPETDPGVVYLGTVMRGPKTEASERAHVVEQILDRALPEWAEDRPAKDKDYSWLRNHASRGKAALLHAEKLGDKAPRLSASSLHPWAWENGKSDCWLWLDMQGGVKVYRGSAAAARHYVEADHARSTTPAPRPPKRPENRRLLLPNPVLLLPIVAKRRRGRLGGQEGQSQTRRSTRERSRRSGSGAPVGFEPTLPPPEGPVGAWLPHTGFAHRRLLHIGCVPLGSLMTGRQVGGMAGE